MGIVARLTLALAVLALLAGGGRAQDGGPGGAAPDSGVAGLPVGDVVTAIYVSGNERYTDDQLKAAFGVRVGQPLVRDEVGRGLRSLWDTFHVRADVQARPGDGGTELLLLVREALADFEPRFVGNVQVGLDDLLEWADLPSGTEMFPSQAQRVRRQLEDRYRAEGFYFCEVDIVSRDVPEGAPPDVIFEIREGPKVHVRRVVVTGNESLPDRGIFLWKSGLRYHSRAQLKGPVNFGLWKWFRKALIDEVLHADLLAMSQAYRDRGWLDVVIDHRIEFSNDRRWATVHIEVDEGPRYTVGSVALEAIEWRPDPGAPGRLVPRESELVFPLDEVLAECGLEPGEPYSSIQIVEDARALRSYYGSRGYLSHPSLPQDESWSFLEPLVLYDYANKQAHVTYRIAQGREHRIREIRFAGNLHTRDAVVRRELSVFPGMVADLDEIQRSTSRLTRTGYFSDSFRTDHPEPTFRFLDTGEPGWKDLEFVVAEGNLLDFSVSGGAGSAFGVFGSMTLGLRNFDITNLPGSLRGLLGEVTRQEAFHGAGQSLDVLLQPGTQVSRYRLRITEPDLFESHLDRYSGTFNFEQRFRRFQSHDERRRLLGATFGRQLTPDSSVSAGFEVSRLRVNNLNTGGEPSLLEPGTVPAILVEQEGEWNLYKLQAGYTWRTINHLYSPTEGHVIRARLEVSDDLWGSDFDYGKLTFNGDFYRSVGETGEGIPIGMKFWVGAGVAQAWGSDDFVPYTERFFLGGTTLRGFDLRGVGPNENGLPIGGETMIRTGIEYRYPLLSAQRPGSDQPLESVRGLLFIEGGILDPDSFSLDTDEVRASVGFGFGLTQPLPLTLAFAFPIADGEDDDDQLIFFNLGL